MSTPSPLETMMLDLINLERTERGISPLAFDLLLNTSSEDHSDWIQSSGRFSHTGQGGSGATERMVDAGFQLEGSWRTGENLAFQSERGATGYADDVAQLHEGLMNSPGHRANILNPQFESIGIGIETGTSALGRFDAVIVTQNFATSSAANAPYEAGADAGAAVSPTTPGRDVPQVVAQPQAKAPTARPEKTPVETAAVDQGDGIPAPWQGRLDRWQAKAEKFQQRLESWEARTEEPGAALKVEAWQGRLDKVQTRLEGWIDRVITKTDRKAARTEDSADDALAAQYAAEICDEVSTWSVSWAPDVSSQFCDVA